MQVIYHAYKCYMPNIVGTLTFMSRIKFMLSGVENGKRFITSGLSHDQSQMLRLNSKAAYDKHKYKLLNMMYINTTFFFLSIKMINTGLDKYTFISKDSFSLFFPDKHTH